MEAEDAKACYAVAQAGIARRDELAARNVRLGKLQGEDGIEARSLAYQRLMHEIYTAERVALIDLRNEGKISAEGIGRIMPELDLEGSRLEI